jgi:hypothetical protein
MKQVIYHLKRDVYGQDAEKRETTLGKMLTPTGDLFGYVLEDVVRAMGIKRKTSTAIPATREDFTYRLKVMHSPKYGKVVTVFTHTEGDVPVLEYDGSRFEYIRCHGGNNSDDTDGCLLICKNRETKDMAMRAWGSLKEEFAKQVEELELQGYDVKLRVTNLPQAA